MGNDRSLKLKMDVKYHIQGLCILVTFVPVLVTGMTVYLYVSNGHHRLNTIETLWEAVSMLPECRIFSIGMNMVGWILACLVLLYDRYLTLKGAMSHRILLNTCGGVASLSIIGFSSVTYADSKFLNAICVTIFWTSICAYMIMTDLLEKSPMKKLRLFYNVLIITCWIASSLLKEKLSIGAVLEYLAFILTFFKVGMTWKSSKFGSISLHMVKKSK